MDLRQMKGLQIAQTLPIKKTDEGWRVSSQKSKHYYLVRYTDDHLVCNCEDYTLRASKCKHIYAVEYCRGLIAKPEIDMKKMKIIKISYAQDSAAYNKSQINEGKLFVKLLSDLCAGIPNPTYEFGRPRLLLSDMIFASALKVYSTFSLRRFMSFMETAKQAGYVEKICSYSTVSNYIRDPEITYILEELIKKSSLPLASIETDFAVDSSGFSTSRFARYHSFKHGRDIRYTKWLKAHIICGVKTNVITHAEISKENAHDSPYFKTLVEKTKDNFQIQNIFADKAYSSRENYEIVQNVGGTAYIPFRSNAKGRAGSSYIWRKMYHYFNLHREEFLSCYHQRSNVESTFHMIKTKFRDSLMSRDETGQMNELLLKILCHNIVVLIHEVYELGINLNSFNAQQIRQN